MKCLECGEPVEGRHKSDCGKRSPETDHVFPEDCGAPVEIMSMPVLSTAHLTKDEGQRHAGQWPSSCYENEYGFIAHFGTVADVRDSIDAQDETPEDWPGFLAAAEWAEKLGYSWVRFDCDGERQDGLPEWEW